MTAGANAGGAAPGAAAAAVMRHYVHRGITHQCPQPMRRPFQSQAMMHGVDTTTILSELHHQLHAHKQSAATASTDSTTWTQHRNADDIFSDTASQVSEPLSLASFAMMPATDSGYAESVWGEEDSRSRFVHSRPATSTLGSSLLGAITDGGDDSELVHHVHRPAELNRTQAPDLQCSSRKAHALALAKAQAQARHLAYQQLMMQQQQQQQQLQQQMGQGHQVHAESLNSSATSFLGETGDALMPSPQSMGVIYGHSNINNGAVGSVTNMNASLSMTNGGMMLGDQQQQQILPQLNPTSFLSTPPPLPLLGEDSHSFLAQLMSSLDNDVVVISQVETQQPQMSFDMFQQLSIVEQDQKHINQEKVDYDLVVHNTFGLGNHVTCSNSGGSAPGTPQSLVMSSIKMSLPPIKTCQGAISSERMAPLRGSMLSSSSSSSNSSNNSSPPHLMVTSRCVGNVHRGQNIQSDGVGLARQPLASMIFNQPQQPPQPLPPHRDELNDLASVQPLWLGSTRFPSIPDQVNDGLVYNEPHVNKPHPQQLQAIFSDLVQSTDGLVARPGSLSLNTNNEVLSSYAHPSAPANQSLASCGAFAGPIRHRDRLGLRTHNNYNHLQLRHNMPASTDVDKTPISATATTALLDAMQERSEGAEETEDDADVGEETCGTLTTRKVSGTGGGFHACSHPGCGKVFSRPHNLKSHMAVHMEEKPFPCSHCSRQFRRNNDLKRHVRQHTGETPFGCKACGKTFFRSDALARHHRVEKCGQ